MGCEPHILNAGWQFSYLGDETLIKQKIQAFAHSELDTPQWTNMDHIRGCINNGIDLFGRDINMEVVPIDNSFPEYIVENQAALRRFIA